METYKNKKAKLEVERKRRPLMSRLETFVTPRCNSGRQSPHSSQFVFIFSTQTCVTVVVKAANDILGAETQHNQNE